MFLLHPNSFALLSCTFSFFAVVTSTSHLRGAHPLDETYLDSDVIKCKDGSGFFTKDRLNDDYCDCPDGTDEPGTAACPAGKFYCRNFGSSPEFIFSSRVNDYICDCCDGSDEYDSGIPCPNTCIMGGNVRYKSESRHRISTVNHLGSTEAKEIIKGVNVPDLVQKLKGLKLVTALQLSLIGFLVILWVVRRRVRSGRRHYR